MPRKLSKLVGNVATRQNQLKYNNKVCWKTQQGVKAADQGQKMRNQIRDHRWNSKKYKQEKSNSEYITSSFKDPKLVTTQMLFTLHIASNPWLSLLWAQTPLGLELVAHEPTGLCMNGDVEEWGKITRGCCESLTRLSSLPVINGRTADWDTASEVSWG